MTTETIPGMIRPAAEMSADNAEKEKKARLLQRVQELRSNPRRLNDAEVTGDPEKVYCWVYNHPQMIAEYERLGYTVVSNSNGKTVQSRWRANDGTHKRGDTILMQTGKEDAEALEIFAAMSAVEQVSNAKAQFMDFANGAGIPLFQKA